MACELQISNMTKSLGDIVTLRPYPNAGYGLGEQPNDQFIYLQITDANVQDVQDTSVQSWDTVVDYTTIGTNTDIDGYRLDMFVANPGVSGLGDITREQAEAWLNRWNAVVVSASKNNVRFDIWAFDNLGAPGAIQSEGLWGRDTTGVIFNEILYSQGNGTHRVSADYSVFSNASPKGIENRITDIGGTIISHPTNVVTFTVTRSGLYTRFKNDVSRKLSKLIAKRQFYFGSGVIDTIKGNGGITEATLAEFQTYVKNRLDD